LKKQKNYAIKAVSRRSGRLALATGAGKSVIALSIVRSAKQKRNNVLYLAHRTILIDQMSETLKGFDNVIVESVQRSKNRWHEDIKILVIDECHYGVNSSTQNKVIWDDVIDVVQLKDLIDMGFLAKLKVLAPMHVDTSGFKMNAADYNQKDVAQEVTKSNIIANVVDKYIKYADGLKSIFYAVNIDHATQQRV